MSQGHQALLQQHMVLIQVLQYYLFIYLVMKIKSKNTYLNLLREWFGSYCLTEPTAGSDANSGKTKAVLSDDGSHYKISGQKCGFLMQGLQIFYSICKNRR